MDSDLFSHPIGREPLRSQVEKMVSSYFGYPWRACQLTDLAHMASHPSAILSDGRLAVFVKLSLAANGLDQFEIEKAGLEDLRSKTGVRTPVIIGLEQVGDQALMVQQAEKPVEQGEIQWLEIGRTIARIHQVKGASFGYDRQGYFGPLYQDNRQMDTWLNFFLERRLWPRLAGAIESGHMPAMVIRQVERLIERLPEIDIPKVEPTFLHGDAQKNNFINTADGLVVIDPAVYYGHPEVDLACVDIFQPVTADVFKGYQEVMPIDPGFWQRRDLWRIPVYLAATVGGQEYLPALVNALRTYL